ncbi:MAG: hypothetical protein CVU81_00485 [Euryarchaeota archaeon HGW-Euryarchaeota-1]|nr:MAG: hypothetical protein CVU81_00485 [Euryarchaeota archaeon HGW-Euryarchaeota-1]
MKDKQIGIVFLPMSKLDDKADVDIFKKIISEVRQGNLVLIEKNISPLFEGQLIKETMKSVDDNFEGIEFVRLDLSEKKSGFLDFIRTSLSKFLVGERALTLIGPSSIIKNIKRNPNAISMFVNFK